MKKRTDKAKKTRWQQNHPKAGAHYSPRSLFRGLTVPYSNKPGQKYLHPERHRTVKEAAK